MVETYPCDLTEVFVAVSDGKDAPPVTQEIRRSGKKNNAAWY
jgi:hypothetical protein